MYIITGKIKGLAPILFNAPDLDMLKPAGSQRQKTEEQRDEESLKRAYINDDGQLFLPAWNLKKCLLEGFKVLDLRVPGSKMKRLWKFVQPVIFIENPPQFGIKNPDFIKEKPAQCFLHKIPGKNSDGSATIVRRPCLREWELPFQMKVLDDLVRAEDVHTALQASGERVGLGGWRPEFGRFEITDWAVEAV